MLCQALITALTLSSYAFVAIFSCGFILCILFCLFQRSLAFSLRISAKFKRLIWCIALLPPFQHLIGLTLKSVYTPFHSTYTSQSLSTCGCPQEIHISPVPFHSVYSFLPGELSHSYGINYHLSADSPNPYLQLKSSHSRYLMWEVNEIENTLSNSTG